MVQPRYRRCLVQDSDSNFSLHREHVFGGSNPPFPTKGVVSINPNKVIALKDNKCKTLLTNKFSNCNCLDYKYCFFPCSCGWTLRSILNETQFIGIRLSVVPTRKVGILWIVNVILFDAAFRAVYCKSRNNNLEARRALHLLCGLINLVNRLGLSIQKNMW